MKRRSYFKQNASMMRLLLIVVVMGAYLLSAPTNSYASNEVLMQQQTIVVNGKVVDQAGTPIPGVNVVVTGTTTGTITDAMGRYTLTVNGDQKLVFSFIELGS